MNKGQHNTFKKLSPDFFSIEISEGIDPEDIECITTVRIGYSQLFYVC